MKKVLRISDKLSLPLDFATSRNMVLAQSGAGKSNLCVVLAEEMHRNGIPWIVLDGKGDWYGVRSSRDGKGRGLDIPVFGGEFGDLPLSPLAGTRMAELVAAGKISGVFDVSDFPKPTDVSRFLIDFANTLLKKQRTPVHVFIEEADEVLPQGGFRGQIDPMAAMCVRAMKRLATKGRFRGIGYTVISQRAAEVNKTVLYQCETLIALRMVGDLDIKWIEGWVKRGSKRASEILDTLPDLSNGECWVWSPQRLKITERVQARRRETFDSGAAPEIGKSRVVPKMAPVEIEALRKELADLEVQAKADDPKELKKHIAELEKELKKKAAPAAPTGRVLEEYEVVVRRDHIGELTRSVDEIVRATAATIAVLKPMVHAIPKKSMNLPAPSSPIFPDGKPNAKRSPAVRARASARVDGASARDPSIGDSGLCRMLIALAQNPVGLTRRRLGLMAGVSSKSGTFSTYLSRARAGGWIDGKSDISITGSGLTALGHYTPLPEGDELCNYWLREIGDDSGAARMLRVLAEAYPEELSRAELGERANISSASGTFSTYLSRLRGLELVEGKSEIRISDELVG